MPASVTQRTIASGPRSSGTPMNSNRSAVPQEDDAARLPCLTTRTPAPATTIAAIVEMLTVWARSPPVPTTSTASAQLLGESTGSRWPASPRPARPTRRVSRPWPAAPPRSRRSARRGVARHDLAHRPGGVGGGQLLAAQQGVEQVRPGPFAHDGPPGVRSAGGLDSASSGADGAQRDVAVARSAACRRSAAGGHRVERVTSVWSTWRTPPASGRRRGR